MACSSVGLDYLTLFNFDLRKIPVPMALLLLKPQTQGDENMKILFPIDGSDCAKATLAWASQFLTASSHQIYLLNVVCFTPEILISDMAVEEGIKMLNEAKVFLETKGFTVAKADYILSMPSQAICTYADENKIDQIIIGSHGRQGLAKFLMGSVSEAVFKQAKQLVLVINNAPHAALTISHAEKVLFSQ